MCWAASIALLPIALLKDLHQSLLLPCQHHGVLLNGAVVDFVQPYLHLIASDTFTVVWQDMEMMLTVRRKRVHTIEPCTPEIRIRDVTTQA